MKSIAWVAALLLAISGQAVDLSAQDTSQIVVDVGGFATDAGELHWALFDGWGERPKEDDALRKGTHPINDGRSQFTIDEVPKGSYALAVFHDKNNNGKFDRFLVPIEAYGFSNYTSVVRRPPVFDIAKFDVTSPEAHIEITVFDFTLF